MTSRSLPRTNVRPIPCVLVGFISASLAGQVHPRGPVSPELLRPGPAGKVLPFDTEHQGLEIFAPVAARLVRYRTSEGVHLSTAKDDSAGGLECFKVETPLATYFLEKSGGGLSSMIDRDGKDWLSFHPEPGSGAAGEYRGFPNAVFKSAGSYFHPRNGGTDPCHLTVQEESARRVVIAAESSNGLWAARYTFTAEACTFTLTKKPAGHNYWVLYEGTPGGQYDDSDWWMTAAQPDRQPLTTTHDGDIRSPEWIAFGDASYNRSLVLYHHQDDDAPDRFYQMQKKMTVFGFGRDGLEKFLDSVPQSFSIRFVESTDPVVIGQAVREERVPSR